MKKLLIALCFVIAYNVSFTQEICNNGVDDDSDGFIDLNDINDCTCSGLSLGGGTIPSVIPNPSFESMACCPSYFGQLSCATGWVQASSATSVYFNTCGFIPGVISSSGLIPFPDGNGVVGTITHASYLEYVGSCLSSPLNAGTSYTLTLNIAAVNLGTCNGRNINFGTIAMCIYGTSSCGNLPFNNGYAWCPPTPQYSLLSTASYTPQNSWGSLSFTFTPTQTINAIVIGAPCVLPPSYNSPNCFPYFLFDNLILNNSSYFESLSITSTGDLCSQNVVLTGVNSTNNNLGTWQWYLNNEAIVGQTSSTLNVSTLGLGAGNYSVIYSLSGQCDITNTTVTGGPPSPINAGPDQIICVGQSVLLNASGASSYSWDNGVGVGNSLTITPSATTVYTVTGTDVNVCIKTDQAQVTVNPLPVVNAGVDQTICIGASVALNGSGASTYTWNNTISNGVPFAPSATTVYAVIGTDINGCINTDQAQVTVNPLPLVNAGVDQIICEGQSLTLSGSGASTYSWDNGVINRVAFTPTVGSTSYIVTGTDSNGCFKSDQLTITVVALPVINFSSDLTSGCVPFTFNLTNLTQYSSNCLWSLRDGSVSNDCGVTSFTMEDPG